MKRDIGPTWSADQLAAGKRTRDAWEHFFSGADQNQIRGHSMRPEELRLAQVRARYEPELLRYPNVLGVATGVRMRRGMPTGESCLVVYVERKVARDQLAAGELLPSEVEGVPVDVVETGRIQPLSG
jgi:hypothetical protein